MRLDIIGQDALLREFDQYASMDTTPLMRRVGEALATSIVKRTATGRDEEDRALKPVKNKVGGRGSTTLWSTGKMLGSIRMTSADRTSATVAPTGMKESQVAFWQHFGTSGPYEIKPKPGHKALSFEATGGAGSFSNTVRVGSRYSRQGAQHYSLSAFDRGAAGRRKVTGMTTVRRVMHPGLTARPFFGISPTNATEVMAEAERWKKELFR